MIRLESLKAQGIKNLEIPSEDDDFDKLRFPEEGKVFIHGLNEAGKSTLFESIYFALFGTALIPDRSKSSMSELLAYDREKGVVELEFTVEDSLYRIRRTIDGSGSRMSYRHQLVIEHPNQKPEGIKGASQVNDRIEQELGLDGDALLNSCFVEQKNLDRLEDSRRQKREESIATLLNLDRFTTMENDYSSKQNTAQEELEEANQKKEIAVIEEEKIPAKEKEKEEVESKLEVIEWKTEVRKQEKDIQDYNKRIEDRIDEIHGLARQIQEINELEEDLPEKKERKEKLDDLHSDFQDLERLDKALEDLRELQSLDNEIQEFDSEISTLEKKRNKISRQLKEVRDSLGLHDYSNLLEEWERLKNAATREQRIEKQEQEHREKKEQAEQELKKVNQRKSDVASKRQIYAGIGAGISVISIVAGALVSPIAFLGVLLGLGAAGYGYVNYDPSEYNSQIKSLDQDISHHNTELTKLEGQREDMADTEAEDPSEELTQVEKKIQELDETVPDTLEDCSKLKSEIEQELEDVSSKSELEEEEERLQSKIPREEEITSKKSELSDKRSERENFDEEEIRSRISDLKKDIVGEEKDRDEIQTELGNQADKLDLEPDKRRINSAKSSLQTEIENDQKQIDKREDIQSQIDEKNQKISDLRENISEAEDKTKKLKSSVKEVDFDPGIEQEPKLNSQRDEIVGNLGDLRGRRDDLRDELNLSEELSLEDVEAEVEEKVHEVKLYNYAEEIVSKSKDQIMRNILPKTEANMARFLPILTNGRYKDVQIDPDSYTIRAYDSRAQAYKSKSIFSGGTKDQFSLALRLSFAMATLPQERGTAPDFLYLDEPVGSFDTNRQEALTELLTRGEIAENFGQIFIVSHVEELKDEFNHQIEMEDGRITKKELE